MNDVMAYGAAAQRRKREFAILATGPIFDWVPLDLRMMFHEVVHCRDKHWGDHETPRGQQIEFYRQDMRGVLSGKIGSTTKLQTFWPSKYFRYYDTLTLSDPKYLRSKFKIKKDMMIVDSSGREIEQNEDEYRPVPVQIAIARKIEELKEKGIKKLEQWEHSKLIEDLGLSKSKTVRTILESRGLHYDLSSRCYILEDV